MPRGLESRGAVRGTHQLLTQVGKARCASLTDLTHLPVPPSGFVRWHGDSISGTPTEGMTVPRLCQLPNSDS